MWKLALQSKNGGREKFEIENTASFMILKYKVFELTNIPPDMQILKTGRPPKEINVANDDIEIKDVGSQLQNMDLIIADEMPPIENDLPPSKKIKSSSLVSESLSLDNDSFIANVIAAELNSAPEPTKSSIPHTFSSKIEPQDTSSSDGRISRKVAES